VSRSDGRAAVRRFPFFIFHFSLNDLAMSPDPAVRRATLADLPVLGRLGASLVRLHYAFDPGRFMAPVPDAENGYAWFLGSQLSSPDAIVLVAERGGHIAGYLYAGVEPRSWQDLREEAGLIHDVMVEEGDRSSGVASALVEHAIEWFKERGVGLVVLHTAQQNEPAQHLFARLGFRRTMVELTKEI
jgi:ribosomal protein S18 acetylase RimI-like enzyme